MDIHQWIQIGISVAVSLAALVGFALVQERRLSRAESCSGRLDKLEAKQPRVDELIGQHEMVMDALKELREDMKELREQARTR